MSKRNGGKEEKSEGQAIAKIETGETFTLVPKSLQEAIQFAEMIANSDLVPADYKRKPGNIVIAVQMGLEVGLRPIQALQNIAVINGRPSVWGDSMLALVRASGLLESFNETLDESTMTATCAVKRKGEPAPSEPVTFSKADAEKAKLWGKQGPWTQYPKRMLKMRARAFALRDTFADVLKGLNMAEEAIDITPVVEVQSASEPLRPPQRMKPNGNAQEAKPEVTPKVTPEVEGNGEGEGQSEEASGNDAEATTISEPQRKRFFAIATENMVSQDYLKWLIKGFGFSSTKAITREAYEEIISLIEQGADAVQAKAEELEQGTLEA